VSREAAVALEVDEVSVVDWILTAEERAFCEEFVNGEHAKNATRCYLRAFRLPDKDYDKASSSASLLLRRPKIEAFLRELYHRSIGEVSDQLRDWRACAIEAQQVVLRVMRGELRNRMQYEAALHVIDRAFGRVPERHELEVINQQRATRALSALRQRMAKAQEVQLVEDGHRPALASGNDPHE